MTPADWDVAVFRAIHHGMHHPWLDPIMMALTDPGPWKFPLLALVALLFLLRGRRGWIGLVILCQARMGTIPSETIEHIAAADQLSSRILKPIFRRIRPSTTLTDTVPLFGRRTSYSFPSTHASNFFSAAPVVSAVVPEVTVVAYAYAAAVCFSRIYVGDHYPSDVVAGTVLGLILGFLGRRAYRRATVTARGERAPSGGP
jgi:undecaprenyl-diphosphatase